MRTPLVDLVGLLRPAGDTDHPEAIMIPRPVVVIVVLVLLGVLSADVGAQFLPGSTHTANPLIAGPIIALMAAIVTGSKGPKPDTLPSGDSARPAPTAEQPAAPTRRDGGRHRTEDTT